MWSAGDLRSANNRAHALADGGATDNLGILPLLRRKVRTIIVHTAQTSAVTQEDFTSTVWWPSLFGRVQVGVGPYGVGHLNSRSQVFESEKYDELLAKLRSMEVQGKPPVAELVLRVLKNDHAGVTGGHEVRILWVVAGVCQAFREALPTETAAVLATQGPQKGVLDLLRGDKERLCRSFPDVNTFIGNYEGRLVQMLAENAAYNLVEGAKLVGGGLERYFEPHPLDL